MELSNQVAGDMPVPLNSTFGHGHMIHHDPAPHNHIIPSTAAPPHIPSIGPTNHHLDHHDHHHNPYYNNNVKKVVKYRECLKNHAAAMGGNATDGCGEFMPSGEEGTIEALNCSACNCHRNFHRKEIEGDHQPQPYDHFYGAPLHSPHLSRVGRKVILGHHHHKSTALIPPEALGYPTATGTLIHSRGGGGTAAPHQMIMSTYNMGSHLPSESDEQGGAGEDTFGAAVLPRGQVMMKKRFRTKFSTEQKEKMLNFAEKLGWKIQKQEESVVQQFCQEIGVKRRVLKVWMHNNKHNLAKKNPSNSTLNNINNNNVTAAAASATTTPAA